MRRLTRREVRLGIAGLVALALFAAFIGLRLQHRADAPNPLPSALDETPDQAQPSRPHTRNQPKATTPSPGGSTGSTDLRFSMAQGAPGTSFSFGPGSHLYVTTVSGHGSLKAIGYKDLNGTKYLRENPAMPHVQRARIQAPGVHLIIAAQIGPEGGSATCTITVDGKTAVSRTVHGPYQVVVCSA